MNISQKSKKNDLSLLSPGEGAKQGLSRELIHAWNELVLRERYSNTPVGFHSATEKQQALSAWQQRREEYQQSHEYVLQSFALPDCDFFVGRQAELSEIEKAFLDGNGQTKLVIHGMGGMGKTALATQAVARLKSRYDKILWLSYRGNLTYTICDDGLLNIKNLIWSGDRYKNQQAYFKEKWQILCDLLHQEKVLLVLDDMNDTKEHDMELLHELPCDILVTSRIFCPSWQTLELALEPMQSSEDWQAFYAGYSAEAVTASRTEQLDTYRQAVQGNTLLMRLAVCNDDLSTLTYNDLESYFLRTDALNATDIQALRYLSLLPVVGIEVHRFLSATGLKEETLRKLTELSLIWVRQRENCQICGLHPVIAESVRHTCKPTPENCRRFLSGLATYYIKIWYEPYTEVKKAIPICFSLLQAWGKLRAWLSDAYDAFTAVLWIGGYFDESLKYLMQLYQACVEYYGEIHQVTGFIALRVATVYHNSLRFDEAKKWYLISLDILQKSKVYNSKYHYLIMLAAFKVARAERHEGHYDAAMQYLSISEQMTGFYCDEKAEHAVLVKVESWFVALEKVKVVAAMGETDKAAAMCEEIETAYKKGSEYRYHFLTELNLLRAELALRQDDATLALRLARECLATTRTMRGETAKETLGCQEVVADALCALGQLGDALKLYRELHSCLRRNYPLQKTWVRSVGEKNQAVSRRMEGR